MMGGVWFGRRNVGWVVLVVTWWVSMVAAQCTCSLSVPSVRQSVRQHPETIKVRFIGMLDSSMYIKPGVPFLLASPYWYVAKLMRSFSRCYHQGHGGPRLIVIESTNCGGLVTRMNQAHLLYGRMKRYKSLYGLDIYKVKQANPSICTPNKLWSQVRPSEKKILRRLYRTSCRK
mmetsp:Transcript_10131/g.20475  ORF Transcript_10131/g.20475 Transcript_10131/m.20475 type:complete len:174 (-) Transcript_10131:76-597(-)